jgi:hypothetical protein
LRSPPTARSRERTLPQRSALARLFLGRGDHDVHFLRKREAVVERESFGNVRNDRGDCLLKLDGLYT